jgi:N-acetylneuraminic acid mutarotase
LFRIIQSKNILLFNENHIFSRTHYSTGVVTVPEGILSVGGYSYATNSAMKSVYLFSNLQWSHVGEMNYATRYNTVYALGSKIFSIAGNE